MHQVNRTGKVRIFVIQNIAQSQYWRVVFESGIEIE